MTTPSLDGYALHVLTKRWDSIQGMTSLAELRDGSLASSSFDENTILIWNTKKGELIKTLDTEKESSHFKKLVVLKDGNLAVPVGIPIQIWNTNTGIVLKTLWGHKNNVVSLVVMQDGSLASGGQDNTILIWNTTSAQIIKELKGHKNEVTTLVILQNGILASGSYDETIRIWDSKNEKEIKLFKHTQSIKQLVVLSNGNLASIGHESSEIQIWNTTSGLVDVTLKNDTRENHILVALHDGNLASSSSKDKNGVIRIWNPENGELIEMIFNKARVLYLAVLKDGSLACSTIKSANGFIFGNITIWRKNTEKSFKNKIDLHSFADNPLFNFNMLSFF